MKRSDKLLTVITIVVGCLIATSAYTIAPLQLKTSLESFVFGFIEVPYNQAVQNKPYTIKLDTGSNNQLVNGSFDDQTEHKGWNEVSVGAWAKTDTGCLEGSCYEITTSTIGDAGALQQTISVAEEYQYVGVVWAYRGATDGGEYEICAGSDCLTIGHEKGKWHPYQLYHFGANPVISVKPMDSFASGDTVDIKVDKARFGLSEGFQKVSDIGEWQDFTPTGTWGNATYSGRYKKISDEAIIEYVVSVTGGNGSTQLLVDLPSSLTADTSLSSQSSTTATSDVSLFDSSAGAILNGSYYISSPTQLATRLWLSSTAVTQHVDLRGDNPIVIASGDKVVIKARVKIQGWSSSTSTVVTQTQQETVKTANRFEASFDGSSGTSPVPVNSYNHEGVLSCNRTSVGLYECSINTPLTVVPSIQCTVSQNETGAGTRLCVVREKTTSSFQVNVTRSDTAGLEDRDFDITVTKQGSDYNKTQVISGSFEAIKSSETPLVVAKGNSDEAITANVTDLPWIEVSDKFNLWDGDSFTVPITGTYHIEGQVLADTTFSGVFAYIDGVQDITVGYEGLATRLVQINRRLELVAGQTLSIRLENTVDLDNTEPHKHTLTIRYEPNTQSIVENLSDNTRLKKDQYSTTEMKWGKWNGEQLYRRCFTIDSDKTTTNTLLYTIDANLVPRNVPRYYNVPSSYALLSASYGTDSFLINYNPSTGEVKSYVTGNYIVKAGTSFCMDYTK